MDDHAIRAAEQCSAGSEAGHLRFPEVIGLLMQAGIERYHADLCLAEKIYYRPDGSAHRVKDTRHCAAPAATFSADGVAAAIRSVQEGALSYAGFCDAIAAAGCVGYQVFIDGGRCVYYGRDGAAHVEPFPGR
jgi:uncharacterized protein YbcV (DUF1398 family)